MKLPEIREKLFEFVMQDGREVALVKNEGFVMLAIGTAVEDEEWETLYAAFGMYVTGLQPQDFTSNMYTLLGRKFGEENELDLYHALSGPEESGERVRRQKWLRRTLMRDLGIIHEQLST